MIDDNYFDASLLIGTSHISLQISQDKFLKLNFENKVGLLVSKITNEALEDNKINFLKVSDRQQLGAIAFFHHWTSILISGYLKKQGRNLDNQWAAKSFIDYFSLNSNFSSKYLAELYSMTNKLAIKMFKDTKKDKTANEVTENYSTLISSYVKHKGLDYKKEINFREIFKHQLQACFDMVEPE